MTVCMTWSLWLIMAKAMSLKNWKIFNLRSAQNLFFKPIPNRQNSCIRVTRDFAELTGNEIVYDLYCGTGSIGIFVSKQAKKIIGVEMIAAAIEDAKENAALNNLDHAEFFAGDVIRYL